MNGFAKLTATFFLSRAKTFDSKYLTLKGSITTAADDKFSNIFPNFQKNKV